MCPLCLAISLPLPPFFRREEIMIFLSFFFFLLFVLGQKKICQEFIEQAKLVEIVPRVVAELTHDKSLIPERRTALDGTVVRVYECVCVCVCVCVCACIFLLLFPVSSFPFTPNLPNQILFHAPPPQKRLLFTPRDAESDSFHVPAAAARC